MSVSPKQIQWMGKLIIIVSLAIVGCLSLELGIHKQKHRVSDECCVAKKGKICGKYLKDCCRSDCDSGILGSKWCKEGDEYEPDCETCTDVCKNKGGISCGASLKERRIECCLAENCILPNEADKITDEMADKITTGISEKAEEALKNVKHNVLFDFSSYIQSLDDLAVSGKCEEGTQIQLPQCIEDSFGALLLAKLFG